MADIPYRIRNLHVNIVGNIGCGKSSLITWWAYNDILSEHGGVCVIDPKGDLVDELLRYIPEDRIQDCIVADIDNPLPLDFMSCAPGREDDVIGDLQYMLMGEMAGNAQYPQLNENIENLLDTLINANRHPDLNTLENEHLRCTFLDVYEFLKNDDRRKYILRHVTKKRLLDYWVKLPNDEDKRKITSRINPFVRSDVLSTIFGDPRPRLKIQDVINNKKILLIRLNVQNKNSVAYGKFLMAKIQHAMFSVTDKRKRIPFFLYVDEFQDFRTSADFERVIDMGRGFLLCFTLSITRLEKLTQSMRSALGGLGSYVIFQLNPDDASFYKNRIEKLDQNKAIREKYESAYLDWQIAPPVEDGLDRVAYKFSRLTQLVAGLPPRPVTIQDAIDLEQYHAIYRIGNAKAMIEETPEPGPNRLTQREVWKIEFIKAESIKNYGPRAATSATSGQNRSVDSAPLLSPQVRHDKGNGIDYDNIEAAGSGKEGKKAHKVDGSKAQRP